MKVGANPGVERASDVIFRALFSLIFVVAGLGHFGQPFSVPAVEQLQRRAGREAHDGEQVIGLVPVQRNRDVRPQGGVDEKPDLRRGFGHKGLHEHSALP